MFKVIRSNIEITITSRILQRLYTLLRAKPFTVYHATPGADPGVETGGIW